MAAVKPAGPPPRMRQRTLSMLSDEFGRIVGVIDDPADSGVPEGAVVGFFEMEVGMETGIVHPFHGTGPAMSVFGAESGEITGQVIALEGELGGFGPIQGAIGPDKGLHLVGVVIDIIGGTDVQLALVVGAAVHCFEGTDPGGGAYMTME